MADAARIYQPLSTSNRSQLLKENSLELLVTAPAPLQAGLQRLSSETIAHLTSTPGQLEFTRQDTVDSTKEAAAVVEGAFLVAGFVALLVAAVGVLNVGLATVGERSEELVIRRALGATRTEIFLLVLGSSLLVGFGVAVISAVLVIAAATLVVPLVIGQGVLVESLEIPVQALWYGLLASLATAFFGSVAPALKATKLDVAQALRN